MTDPQTPPRLFPDPGPPGAGAPRLSEQILGVFTAPVPLFRRLASHPRWGAALLTLMGVTLAMVLIWAARVDPDALLRETLAGDPRVAPETIERTNEVWGRLLGLFGAFGVLVGMPAATLFQALLLWAAGRIWPGPDGSPGYRRALSATVVPALVGLPKVILIGALCLARPVHGLAPDAISPLSLGFLLGAGQGRAGSLLRGLDLFAAANLILLYLAARHLLGLNRAGAVACATAWTAVTVGFLLLAHP